MSLQWTFIATFLYMEIFLVVLLMVPFISPGRWQKIFRSRLLSSFSYYANVYFNIFIIILVVLFFDSIRDARKYMQAHGNATMGVADPLRTTNDMKMFRAQRNLYICGFALLLWLVLRRLVTLISRQATIEADRDASKKQAESASAAAKKLMEDQDNKANDSKAGKEAATREAELTKELDTTKVTLKKVRDELQLANVNLDTMKKQATATNTEYDRLMKEHAQLQDKVKTIEGDTGKKDA